MTTIELLEKPKNPTIIEGFPGFGFVSTIATEFLIKHMDAKKIGRFYTQKVAPMAAIHDSKVVDPMEIYYSKKENIVILRALSNVTGAEWEIASIIEELSKQLKAKEIISIEGIVPAQKDAKAQKVFYFTNQSLKKIEKLKIESIKDGIVAGVTGVLLMKADKLPMTFFFAEADPQMPDSRAAGEVIKLLDEYLGLKVDYKPLIKTAEEVEVKIKSILSKMKDAQAIKEEKEASYLG